jgi:Fur family ferric uptake transcriptional regulator
MPENSHREPERPACAPRNTRQKNLILDCLKSSGRRHVTAEEVVDTLNSLGTPVAKSTVYRFLASLEEVGLVRKYILEEGCPACYQFVDRAGACAEHYHLMCMDCGRIVHFENSGLRDALKGARERVSGRKFSIDGPRTVFYGTCPECLALDGGVHEER